MKTALRQLSEDLLSAIAFVVVFQLTGQLILATLIAVGLAIGQFAFSLVRKRKMSSMQWVLLTLVIVLSALTLITKDSRFVRFKPTLAHFAVGAVMLKRGWQQPYLPPIVTDNLSARTLDGWGYAWAGLMFLMGLANLAAANLLSVSAWSVFLVGLLVGKLAFFFVQQLVIRAAIRAKLKAAASVGG
jgi:intracellular septation protein A